MTDHDQQPIRRLLKQALAPIDVEPKRDLWPALLERMSEHPAVTPWYDWVLAALAMALLAAFPRLVPVLMYHL